MGKISVVLATYNEEKNIGKCLEAVKDWAAEIIIVDGTSTDKTVEIAKQYNATVLIKDNPPIFHINKQKAIDMAKYEWILQLDADEIVSPTLAKEMEKVIEMDSEELEKYQQSLPKRKVYLKHQQLLEARDGRIGTGEGNYNAFFLPRLNFFLGKYLRYGGVYPDGVIRLIRKDKAYLPCKDVHEQIAVEGKVGWLQHDLIHMADPAFERYLARNSRYINLIKDELRRDKIGKNPLVALNFFIVKPLHWFFLTQIRHKGILDGFPGIIFSLFSALRFPRAYWRYLWNQ